MKAYSTLLIMAAAIWIPMACSQKTAETETASEWVEISQQQFTLNQMQTGKVENRVFENVVKTTGIITPMAKGSARVTAPIQGSILAVHCNNGQFVKKNQVLAEVGGGYLIELQKDFSVMAANVKRWKSEFDRITLLYNEKVSTEKEFVMAEAEYKASLASYQGAKLQLELVGLPVANLEKGEFYSSYQLKAPIEGYIIAVNTHMGSSVDAHDELFRIVNPEHLHIKLSVFPKDIPTIKVGQPVRIITAISHQAVWGEVKAVGVSIDEETKAIACYAGFTNVHPLNQVANMYIESEIITQVDTVPSLPVGAVITSGGNAYVLALNQRDDNHYRFEKRPVRIGREYQGFYEILTQNLEGELLTQGGYSISVDE